MIPLSLYIHIPWCLQKCPYCDFNSHKSPPLIPEKEYINAIIQDFQTDFAFFSGQSLHSIFIGGGTPSLFSASAFADLFTALQQHIVFEDNIEITLEANPGTVEHGLFSDYRAVGINRLSLGIQSFHAQHLKRLGRIHDDRQAHLAIDAVRKAGFDNFNLDIMHGLPEQTSKEALDDLKQALRHQPSHLSWYQLTIEPNTIFHHTKPTLPEEDVLTAIETEGLALLNEHQFERYEISAFCQNNQVSRHNLNYWLFGDYYGIGAGAHGKLTQALPEKIYRTQKHRQPKEYLDPNKPYLSQSNLLDAETIAFEFMLNVTRLEQAIPFSLFQQRTGLCESFLRPKLIQAQQLGLLSLNDSAWQLTPLGRLFTNDLQTIFLPV